MDAQFWRDRWAERKIGFHEGQPNAFLTRHAARLGTRRRVLVPLCGMAEDLRYLAGLGHEVIGVELVEDAVREFFAGTTPEVTAHPRHTAYRGGGVTILAGDYFAVTPAMTGACDALYDRAALIALPPELRPRYVEHTRGLLAPGAPGLLITLEYPQDRMAGPPFSVDEAEVRALHGDAVTLLDARPTENPRMRELGITARERCYALGR